MEQNLCRISRELAACQRKLRRRAAAEIHYWGLTRRLMNVVVAIYVISSFNLSVAVAFAARERKKRRYLTDPPTADPPVGAWLAEMSFDEAQAFLEPHGLQQVRIVDEAKRFLAEAAAAQWVRSMNEEHHVAPPTIDLVRQYQLVLQQHGHNLTRPLESSMLRRDGVGGRPGRFMKAWRRQFRKRWQLRLGSLSNQVSLPSDEVRSKAGCAK